MPHLKELTLGLKKEYRIGLYINKSDTYMHVL